MRISDWSSDVCSSDLVRADDADDAAGRQGEGQILEQQLVVIGFRQICHLDHLAPEALGNLDDDLRLAGGAVFLCLDALVEALDKIGRASCRERVCQYV